MILHCSNVDIVFTHAIQLYRWAGRVEKISCLGVSQKPLGVGC